MADEQFSTQPVPHVTADDVERIVRREFPTDQRDAVMSILQQYGVQRYQVDSLRVRLACLKLAKGQLDHLKKCVTTAIRDFRDVLAPAEFPEYVQKAWGKNLPRDERNNIIRSDWEQYQKWLNR